MNSMHCPSAPAAERDRPKALCRAAAAALALAAAGAWAQDSRSQIEEVIVVAEKRTENLQEVPTAVSAFSQETIEAIGSYEFKDIANFAPNVTIREQPGSNTNYAFGIRGVAAGETQLAVDNPVGLYIDGVYLGRLTGTAMDTIEIERMEVLRGPQGTLYGRNSVGGAINLITRKPAAEFGVRNRLTVGSEQLRNQLRVDFGAVDMGGSTLAAQLNVLYASQDATLDIDDQLGSQPDGLTTSATDVAQKATFETETDNDDQTGLRLSLNWDFGESFSADLNFNYSKSEGISDRQQIVHIAGDNFPIFDSLAEFDTQERQDSLVNMAFLSEESTEISGANLSLDWEMGNGMRLKSITAFRNQEASKGNPGLKPVIGIDFGSARVENEVYVIPAATASGFTSGTGNGVVVDPLDLLRGGWTTVNNPVPEGTIVSMFRAGRDEEQSQVSQEFQLSGDIGENVDFVAGLYYFAEETDARNPQISLTPGFFQLAGIGRELRALRAVLRPSASPEAVTAAVTIISNIRDTESEKAEDVANGFPASFGACGGSLPSATAGLALTGTTARVVSDTKTVFGAYVAPCWNSSVVGGNPDFMYGTDNTALAAYGHFRVQATEQLEVGVGLRYTQDEREAYLHTASSGDVDERNTGEDDYSKLDYSLSLGYQASENLNLYGKLASGYRSGGFNARAISADRGFRVEAENLVSLELGLKSEFWDGRGRANVALFQAKYTDRQVSLFTFGIHGATSVITNAGELTNSGAELELTLLPTDGLTLNLNLGMLDVEIEKWDEIPARTFLCGGVEVMAGVLTDLAACRYQPYSPEFNWSALLRYDFEPFAWGHLSVLFDANYQDAYTFTAAQSPDTSVTAVGDERTLVGARLSLSDIALGPGTATVSLWGENIFDEEYKEFPIDFTGAYSVASFGREASFGLDLQYEF